MCYMILLIVHSALTLHIMQQWRADSFSLRLVVLPPSGTFTYEYMTHFFSGSQLHSSITPRESDTADLKETGRHFSRARNVSKKTLEASLVESQLK